MRPDAGRPVGCVIRTTHITRLLAAALVVAVTAPSCTDEPAPAPARSSSLVVGTTHRRPALDPARCFEAFCAYALLPNIHLGLLRYGAPMATVEPALASSWEVSEDGTEYRFRLRTDRTLHDGTPITAGHVKASLERLRDAGDDGPAFLYFDLDATEPSRGIIAVEAPDERTVVVRLATPDASLPAKLAFPAAAVVAAEPGTAGAPAGAGPYRLDRSEADGTLHLERVDGGGPPRVTVRPFPSAAALRAALRRGEVHVAAGAWAPAELSDLSDEGGLTLTDGPSPATRLLAFDVRAEPVDDADVRRAVAAALDRGALATEILQGAGTPLHSLVPEGIAGHDPRFEDIEAPDNAPEVSLDLWYTPSHYGPDELAMAEAVSRSLERAGFEVTLHALEWAAFKAALAEGRMPMFLLGWFPDVLDPAEYLTPFLSAAGSAAIGVHYDDPDADELVAELRITTDTGSRVELAGRLQELAARDLPYVPLVQSRYHLAFAPGVDPIRPQLARWLPLWTLDAASGRGTAS